MYKLQLRAFYVVIFMSYLLWNSNGFAQINQYNNEGYALTKEDSIIASKIPALKLPYEYLLKGNKDLPSELNNADLPFFRPTFSQNPYWNCGQSAGIGYAFCYEINRARGLPGDLLENQQSVNFTWNFMNTGDGWGVSYLQSFDILKACGNPNLADYGGLFSGGEKRWMSGYELYENAMQNRIRNVYYIDVSSEEGLTTLKYWLYDHLDGSDHGGVANFYLQFYNSDVLPDDSDEAGQPIIIETIAPAGHAMTITGYNDSIRYDVNGDGKYTNNEDINDDGVIDMKDWEIGGLKYKNSSLYNDGYGLIMYRALALEYGKGGIWNNQVHVLDVKEEYTPLITMRLKIKHNSREKIKLIAGVSQDTIFNVPEYTIDYPIFNYQGGDNYMQGFNDDETNKIIEISLDISPLLSYIDPGTDAKYFIQVAEKDDMNTGSGEILYFSIVDHSNENEIVSHDTPRIIDNNTVSSLSIILNKSFEKVEIVTNDLSAIIPGEYSSCQISAMGGVPPYQWEVVQPYNFNHISLDFPESMQTQLVFEEEPLYGISVDLPFPFPYYNDTLDKITVFEDGFIMFNDNPFPYPYFIGEKSMLINNKLIAPFLANLVSNTENDEGVWLNAYSDFVEILWNVSIESYENNSGLNFALKLFEDGRIETHYGVMTYPESIMWSAGISNGDQVNYNLNTFFHQIEDISNMAFEYTPPQVLPASIQIDQNGLLSMYLSDDSNIFEIEVQVKDENEVKEIKSFQVPSELIFEYQIEAGSDNSINYYDTVSVSFFIKNISLGTYHDIEMDYSIDDIHFSILKDHAIVGTLAPQQSMLIDSALVFIAWPGVPDQYTIYVSNILSSDEKDWTTDIMMKVDAPQFGISDILIHDNQNGVLDPGEEAELSFTITNHGHAHLNGFKIVLSDSDNAMIIDNPIIYIEHLGIGDTIHVVYYVKAKRSIPTGTEIEVATEILLDDISLSVIERTLLIGKIPVIILDLEPKHLTGPILMELFDSLQLKYNYTTSYPSRYDDYMSIFICLGSLFYNAEISDIQADILSDYLMDGGNIYMEGRVTWNQDEPSSFHQLFNIEAENAIHYFEFDSIYGVENQFTDQMKFDYTSDKPYNNYYIKPIGTAYPILNSGKTDSACAIAYSHNNYKTIGSSFEMNSLVDIDSISTVRNYLLGIIDFFELSGYLYTDIYKTQKSTETYEIIAYPNPFENEIRLNIKGNLVRGDKIQIFDLSGRFVNQILLNESFSKNSVSLRWDGTNFKGQKLSKGFYILKLVTQSTSISKKVLYR